MGARYAYKKTRREGSNGTICIKLKGNVQEEYGKRLRQEDFGRDGDVVKKEQNSRCRGSARK